MSVLDALLEGHVAEAFAAGGPFNAGAHPRGTGGMFIATGSQGAGVSRVQGAVGAKQDGQYGQQTKQKIMAYQRAHGLKVDGVIGRQTAAALLGNRNAKSVAVGAMSADQARRLGAKVPKGSGSRARSSTGTRPRKARAAKQPKPAPPTYGKGGLLVG